MTVTELTDTCHRFDWHPVAAGVEFSVPGKLIIISLLLDSFNFKLWRIAHSEICCISIVMVWTLLSGTMR